MELDAYLRTVRLLDCDGTVSHELVLGLDGIVEVRFASGARARIDPAQRTNLTPRVPVTPALLDQAVALAS